jgi:hypothetical protein
MGVLLGPKGPKANVSRMHTPVDRTLICEPHCPTGTLERNAASAQHASFRAFMWASLSSLTCNGWKGLTFKSSYMWSIMVDRGMPSSADLFRVDFTEDFVTHAATAWHVSRVIIGRPPRGPRGLSFTLPVQKERFSHPNIVLSLAVQHQSGLKMSLSLFPWCRWSMVFHEARPLSPTSAR